MSIEIYGSRFRDGEFAGIEFSALAGAFAGLMVKQEPEEIVLELNGTGCAPTSVFFRRAGNEVTSFNVMRPVDDARFYEALLQILQYEGVVVYTPGSPPVLGLAASVKHLPEGMSSALGPGVVVQTAIALRTALFNG